MYLPPLCVTTEMLLGDPVTLLLSARPFSSVGVGPRLLELFLRTFLGGDHDLDLGDFEPLLDSGVLDLDLGDLFPGDRDLFLGDQYLGDLDLGLGDLDLNLGGLTSLLGDLDFDLGGPDLDLDLNLSLDLLLDHDLFGGGDKLLDNDFERPLPLILGLLDLCIGLNGDRLLSGDLDLPLPMTLCLRSRGLMERRLAKRRSLSYGGLSSCLLRLSSSLAL